MLPSAMVTIVIELVKDWAQNSRWRTFVKKTRVWQVSYWKLFVFSNFLDRILIIIFIWVQSKAALENYKAAVKAPQAQALRSGKNTAIYTFDVY